MKFLGCLALIVLPALAFCDPGGLAGDMLNGVILLIQLEIAVFVFEGLAYALFLKIGIFASFFLSFIANIVSFFFGLFWFGLVPLSSSVTAKLVVAVLLACLIEVPLVVRFASLIRKSRAENGGKPVADGRTALLTSLVANLASCTAINAILLSA